MPEASIEQTLDFWSAGLRAVKAQIQLLLRHASMAASLRCDIPRRAARAGAAQDRLDARRGGG